MAVAPRLRGGRFVSIRPVLRGVWRRLGRRLPPLPYPQPSSHSRHHPSPHCLSQLRIPNEVASATKVPKAQKEHNTIIIHFLPVRNYIGRVGQVSAHREFCTQTNIKSLKRSRREILPGSVIPLFSTPRTVTSGTSQANTSALENMKTSVAGRIHPSTQ